MVGTIPWKKLSLPLLAFFALLGCSATSSSQTNSLNAPVKPAPGAVVFNGGPPEPAAAGVMLGIDVLEAQGFAPLNGLNVGLLTHPAGVNRNGISTVDVLRRALGRRLVALFGPEHGIYGDIPAGDKIPDRRDPRTGLMAYSLYGAAREPTKAQLKGIDVLVIDLQDIGVRSYTFNVCMKYAIEGCFKNGVAVMILDRPNPLGGLKVSGPILDRGLESGVGGYHIPYVHGLTIGEIARMATQAPGVLDVSEAVRAKGRITVVPMRGWTRSMTWPDTGLRFVATSPRIQDFAAVVGYAMVGLGCEYSGFTHGIGPSYNFRGIAFKGQTTDQLLQQLATLRIPGVGFRKLTVTDAAGKAATGVYVDVTNWNDWDPTQLSFEMMRLACRLAPPNPFTKLTAEQTRSFNIHVGSNAWWAALKRDGARVDVDGFEKVWQERNAIYQQQTKKYWLYN